VRPITAGKCVCDVYTASTKVRPVARTRDGHKTQTTGQEAGGRIGSRRPCPQGPLRLKPPDLEHVADIIKRRWPSLVIAKDELIRPIC